MNRNSFLRTLGGLAALIPALKTKATAVESTKRQVATTHDLSINVDKTFSTERESPNWKVASGEKAMPFGDEARRLALTDSKEGDIYYQNTGKTGLYIFTTKEWLRLTPFLKD